MGRILSDMSTMNCINPATEEVIGPVPVCSASQIEEGLRSAADGFAQWRGAPIDERGRFMKSVAGVLRRKRDTLSQLMASEMGKPITAG